MNRKLVSVLLALTMCVGLAIPAFAEEAGELPIPEETVLISEEVHKYEEVGYEAFSCGTAGLNWKEVATEDGIVRVAECCAGEPMPTDSLSSMAGIPGGNCPQCGQDNFRGEPQDSPYMIESDGNPSTHIAHYWIPYTCQTGGCWYVRWVDSPVRESHSLNKTDFGSDYHRGSLHYIEWYCVCNDCGDQTTKWESQPCPGNNNGEGCVFGINKEKPPVEEQDVTEPEETDQTE